MNTSKTAAKSISKAGIRKKIGHRLRERAERVVTIRLDAAR